VLLSAFFFIMAGPDLSGGRTPRLDAASLVLYDVSIYHFETMPKMASASLGFQGAPPRDADHHRRAHRHATGAVAVSQEVSALRVSAILEGIFVDALITYAC
jgi:hypothetical protein